MTRTISDRKQINSIRGFAISRRFSQSKYHVPGKLQSTFPTSRGASIVRGSNSICKWFCYYFIGIDGRWYRGKPDGNRKGLGIIIWMRLCEHNRDIRVHARYLRINKRKLSVAGKIEILPDKEALILLWNSRERTFRTPRGSFLANFSISLGSDSGSLWKLCIFHRNCNELEISQP